MVMQFLLRFRFAKKESDSVGVAFIIFTLFYFIAAQGLKYSMVPKVEIANPHQIMLDNEGYLEARGYRTVENGQVMPESYEEGGYYAATSAQERPTLKVKITKEQYQQFKLSEATQFTLLGLYIVIFMLIASAFKKRYPELYPTSPAS
jgi:hypothetical protein